MTKKIIYTACPRDCWDSCSLKVTVKEERVTEVRGNPEHILTRGFACSKAQKELERLYSPQRLLYPMIKNKQGWKKIEWEEALDLITVKINNYRKKYGSLAIMHYSDAGNMGWLHDLSKRFFNLLGGVTATKGSLCSAAGKAAQKLDFGGVIAHDPLDILNARNIIIWGRNPAYTNIHLLPLLQEVREKGARITLIDPVPTKTAKFCDRHIAPRPGTDYALALGMSKVILERNLEDRGYIHKNVKGFAEFKKAVANISLTAVEKITEIDQGEIISLATNYAVNKPASILIGYGLQRYQHGGHTVRAIDALGAVTGNIGVSGGGLNYSCNYQQLLKPDITAQEKVSKRREFPKSEAAEHILQADDPPVKALFVTTANPAAQLPHSHLFQKALAALDFTVVVDLEMTATAELADLVLPATTFFEQENIFGAWGHNYITYGEQAVTPRGEAKDDWEIFAALANRLGFAEEFGSSEKWIKTLLKPFLTGNKETKDLKGKTFRCKGAPYVAWEDGNFKTPSGKFELYIPRMQELNHIYKSIDKKEKINNEGEEKTVKYPLYLLSPAHRNSIHSQFYENVEPGEYPLAHISAKTAHSRGIEEGVLINIITERGKLAARAVLHENYRDDVILVYCGGSSRKGKGINLLTPHDKTDIGYGASFYDCRCDIKLR